MHDLIVIGAGSGGLAAAKRAANEKLSVLLIEEDTIGGTCVSYGCVPKKLWHGVAQCGYNIEKARQQGWDIENKGFDWSSTQEKITGFIKQLNERHEATCKKTGVEIVRGQAILASPTEVSVDEQTYTGKHILIAVGSKAHVQDIPGAQFCDTSYEFFAWKKQPKTVVIWGGGYIAVELGGILNALGTDVHIVIRKDHVLSGFDADFNQWLHKEYQRKGIHFHTDASISSIEKTSDRLLVTLTNHKTIEADRVIQALGRKPKTDGLNCEAVGVKRNGHAIIVNKTYQTSQPSISAIGDCIDHGQLTPVAIAQAREWVDKQLLNKVFPVDYHMIPTAIFSFPEAASVGVSETEAKEKYPHVTSRVLTFNPLTRALCDESKEPVWIKLIFATTTERLVGVCWVSEGAAEIIQTLTIAMQNGCCKADLDITMALHPSITEEIVTIY